jgi:hypothetical protein
MTRRNKAFILGAALVAMPGAAAAKDVCSALNRIAAAARETPPFDSLGRAMAEGEIILPGFANESCTIAAGHFSCRDMTFVVANFQGWPEPLTCPGLSPAVPSREPRGRQGRQHAYILSGVRIEYGVSCQGCAGGAAAYFAAGPEARGRAEE